jgi:tetratricopeptide (TPR) repeat protein
MPASEDRGLGATWMIEHPEYPTPDDFAAIVQNRELPEDLKRRAVQVWESHLKAAEESGSFQPRIHFIQWTSPRDEIPTKLETLRNEVKTEDDRRALASAFLNAGNPREALEILPLRQAVARKDLFLVWLDAMAATGAWDEIRDVLLSGNIPLEPGLTSLYLGRCYEASGNASAASLQYDNAARFITKDQDLLFYIAGYFHRWQRPQMAEFVLRRLTGDPQSSRMAYEALLNIHRANRDEEKMFEVLNEMHERWPQDLAVANDRNYLSLLLDQKIARTLESSRKLAIEHPELFPLQITHSLALLKSGRRADALKVFESSNVQLRQLLPFQKAVFATVLRANGKEAVGEQIWRQIDPSVLLPREQALFEKISSHDPLDQTPEDILPEAER